MNFFHKNVKDSQPLWYCILSRYVFHNPCAVVLRNRQLHLETKELTGPRTRDLDPTHKILLFVVTKTQLPHFFLKSLGNSDKGKGVKYYFTILQVVNNTVKIMLVVFHNTCGFVSQDAQSMRRHCFGRHLCCESTFPPFCKCVEKTNSSSLRVCLIISNKLSKIKSSFFQNGGNVLSLCFFVDILQNLASRGRWPLSVTIHHFSDFSGELLNKRDLMHFYSWTGKSGATLIWTPRVISSLVATFFMMHI